MYVMLDDFEHRHDAAAARRRDRARVCRSDFSRRSSGGLVNVFGAPPVEGLGTAGGFKIVVEDRGDLGLDEPRRRSPSRSIDEGERAAGARRAVTPASGRTRRGCTSTSTAPRPRRWACRCSRSFNTLAGLPRLATTSTTSTASAAPGRSTCRRTPTFRQRVEDLQQLKVQATTGARWCRFGAFASVREVSGPVMLMRYNMYPAAIINAQRRRRLQLRPGHRAAWRRPSASDLPAHDAATSGPSWPCCSCRPATRPSRLRPGGGAGVPGAGGAVRELVAAAGGHPGGADVPAVLGRRRGDRGAWTSTSSRRSASWCWWAWRARTPS